MLLVIVLWACVTGSTAAAAQATVYKCVGFDIDITSDDGIGKVYVHNDSTLAIRAVVRWYDRTGSSLLLPAQNIDPNGTAVFQLSIADFPPFALRLEAAKITTSSKDVILDARAFWFNVDGIDLQTMRQVLCAPSSADPDVIPK